MGNNNKKKEEQDYSALTAEEIVAELEKRRKKMLTFSIIGGIFAVLLGVPAGIFISYVFSSGELMFLTPVLCVLFVIGVVQMSKKKYVKIYKEYLVRPTLGSVLSNVNFLPNSYIQVNDIRNALLLRVGNRTSGDDYVQANYKGHTFVQCDLKLQHRVSTAKSSHTVTYFYGKFIILDFNKDFSEYVQIRERKEINSAQNVLLDGASKVEFESELFNKEFNVYCTDDHTAFYLLSPPVIETLRKLRDVTQGHLSMSFSHGKLYIAINTNQNSMEPKLTKPVTMQYVDEIKTEIKTTTNFIDELLVDKMNYKSENINKGDLEWEL